MTPIGHASVSFITGKSLKNISLPAIIIGGLLPDGDFIFVLFDWFNQVHRVVTHNLMFVLLASVVFSFFASSGNKRVVGFSLLLGGLLHLLIDACMDNNPTNGIGIALLWPFSNDFYSPFNLLQLSSDPQGWNKPLRMIETLLPSLIYELPFYLVSIILLVRRRLKIAPLS